MAISFVGGKPGAGKTLYSVGLIIRELLTTDRLVVTNVPLKLDRLNEYLQQQAPDKLIPLVGSDSRLIVLDDNEEARILCRQYSEKYYKEKNEEQREAIYHEYEKRIKALDVALQTREFWKFRDRPGRRFDEDTGVLFVLDELHIHFNARKWMLTGEDCLHYLSQHRKLGDDVICITQALGNVDKQFRSVAEDFTVIVNESKKRLGPFKGRNRFVRASYYKEPQGNRDQPFERADFTLDVHGVASCYDTAAGVGVHGNKADSQRKTKGIPIMVVLPLAILLVAVVAGLGPMLLGKLTGAYLAPPDTPEHINLANPAINGATRDTGAGDQFTPYSRPEPQRMALDLSVPQVPTSIPVESPLYVSGVTILNRPGQVGRYSIVLSDGRTINESDGVIAGITRNRVKFRNGQELWIGPPSGVSQNRRNNRFQESNVEPPELVKVARIDSLE